MEHCRAQRRVHILATVVASLHYCLFQEKCCTLPPVLYRWDSLHGVFMFDSLPSCNLVTNPTSSAPLPHLQPATLYTPAEVLPLDPAEVSLEKQTTTTAAQVVQELQHELLTKRATRIFSVSSAGSPSATSHLSREDEQANNTSGHIDSDSECEDDMSARAVKPSPRDAYSPWMKLTSNVTQGLTPKSSQASPMSSGCIFMRLGHTHPAPPSHPNTYPPPPCPRTTLRKNRPLVPQSNFPHHLFLPG